MMLATLCYLQHDGRTLMMHRIKKENDIHKGKWNGLGGKLRAGETPEECAIREVEEECGLHMRNPSLKGVLTFPAFDGFEDWYVFVFVATEFEGILIDSKEGYVKWIDDSELLKLPLWEGDRIFLEWLDQKEFFSAKFVYERGILVNYGVNFHK